MTLNRQNNSFNSCNSKTAAKLKVTCSLTALGKKKKKNCLEMCTIAIT